MRHYALFLLATFGCGCGSSTVLAVDAGPSMSPDADVSDSGSPPTDAGSPDVGAPDAGPPDAGAPDAGPVLESCDMPGAMRTGPCGRCGISSQRCSEARVWESVSACIMEGECSVGAVETRATAGCGEETRLCTDACSWTDWARSAPDSGACTVGDTRRVQGDCAPGFARTETCSTACEWVATSECIDECGGVPRTSPDYAREVCVPAGTFIRGRAPGRYVPENETPEAEVTLSAYYIDVFPVTNDRYRACVTAGFCEVPQRDDGQLSFHDPTRGAHPVQGLGIEQARAFCEWDGRRMPTEAEWEKAARGPAPRRNLYPWNGDSYRCDLLYSGDCGYDRESRLLPDRYDALPGTRSYYGTELQYGGALEWVSDLYSETYYASPESLVDPTGPSTGNHTYRGAMRDSIGSHITYRRGTSTTGPFVGIRCARDGVVR